MLALGGVGVALAAGWARCSVGASAVPHEMAPVNAAIHDAVTLHLRRGDAAAMSVYFRDLDHGPEVAVDADTTFIPGSLMKVPLMLAYFKWAEADRAVLDRAINYVQADYTQNVRPAGGLELGRAYPASTLIERMITESDNNAAIALGGGDADTWMARVFADLGLPRPRIDYPVGHYETSPRHFATFFRALFSASYLDQAHSDRALELLARTAFRRGLVAGVPADVRVAHKFGERTVGSQVELHDCGIVYCPERPYVLCVMTRGHDLDHLVSAVAEVSRATYQAVAADASHAPGH